MKALLLSIVAFASASSSLHHHHHDRQQHQLGFLVPFAPSSVTRSRPHRTGGIRVAQARHSGRRNALFRLAAGGEVDAKTLQSWSEKWSTDNTKDGKQAKTLIFDHPSLAEVLAEVFDQVLDNEKEGKEAGERLLFFPEATKLFDGSMMRQLSDHLDLCEECCEVMGMSQNTIAFHPSSQNEAMRSPVPAILIKPILQGSSDFDADPYWDDDDDEPFGMSFGDEELDEESKEAEKLYHVPEDDATIFKGMKGWTDAIIADLGVCPFTVSAEKAGLPQGAIRYEIERSSSVEAIYAKYWKEVALISGGAHVKNERELSTTLLITPNFALRNREFFESFSNTLTQPLEALKLEEDIQLVFFHPDWVFRDGADRMGNDGAANYARRSPWPMINILRTPQVRKAQKAIPTGLVYRQNEVTLDKIGTWRLQKWLVDRDWSEVKNNFRVDRKTVPILSTAQDLLQGLSPEALSEDLEVKAPAGFGMVSSKEEPPTTPPSPPAEPASAAAAKPAAKAATTTAAAVPVPKKGLNRTPLPGLVLDDDEEKDDDWDKPFNTNDLIDKSPPSKSRRSYEDIVAASRAVINLLRKRLSGKTPLSPPEIKEMEEMVDRLKQ